MFVIVEDDVVEAAIEVAVASVAVVTVGLVEDAVVEVAVEVVVMAVASISRCGWKLEGHHL